jgi:hypothetical protein
VGTEIPADDAGDDDEETDDDEHGVTQGEGVSPLSAGSAVF